MPRHRPALILILLLLPLVTVALDEPQSLTSRPVRVRLQTLDKPVNITGPGLRYSAEGESREARAIVLSVDAGAVVVNGSRQKGAVLIEADAPMAVDGVNYRGRLRALPSPALLIDEIDLEEYVGGVINHEMDSRWPQAAVDAQTILARTYALKRMEERQNQPYDLDRTVADQVYQGTVGEDALARAAVERTRGRVMVYEGRLASALYHSCCGGRTEVPSAVWGGADQPYQVSVICPHCQRAPRYFWRYPVDRPLPGVELGAMLKLAGEVTAVEVRERTESGRVAMIEVVIGGKSRVFTGQEFRKMMGYDRVWSTAFSLDRSEGGYVFRGSGSGHGVGMCQWGARGMAQKGRSAEEILKFYFPGAEVFSSSPKTL